MSRRYLAVLAAVALTITAPAIAIASPDTSLHTACAAPVSAVPTAQCLAVFSSTGSFGPHAGAPAGFGPADLRDAYKLPAAAGAGQTVAIVDAFDDPTAEADLAVYRRQYGLPACTTANGCFAKVNQDGQASPLPMPDPNWSVEISLDVDMVSAACPGCHILLVEGDDAAMQSLGAAEDSAAQSGAAAVSNSYGLGEFNGMDQYASHYVHPGVPILASSGDSGFRAAFFPAVLGNVIAVGGTSLTRAANARGWSESAWSGAGSACSAWIPKPVWQHDPHCGMRTVADVSAVADPKTGLAVYDTTVPRGLPGWLVVGGTSASAPFVAGVIGLAGTAGKYNDASSLYAHAGELFDATGGSNGYCGKDYLCTGVRGYDAPTGLGSPNGIAAF